VTLGQVSKPLFPVVIETVTVTRPLVLGYFAPVTQAQVNTDEGIASALSHVQFALDDARHCLAADSVEVGIVFATSLVVNDRAHRTVLPLAPPDFPLGAFIFIPGREPQHVAAPAGPSALIGMLGQATARTFNRPGCDRTSQ